MSLFQINCLLFSCNFDIVSHYFNLISHNFRLLSLYSDILSHWFDLIFNISQAQCYDHYGIWSVKAKAMSGLLTI